jgi:type II secretory pathway component GspD/PulD (secretin)
MLHAEENSLQDDEAEKLIKKNNVVIKYVPEEKLITEKIYFETLDYGTIKAQCDKMLSPDGYILYVPERNVLIVHDTAKTIDKIRELVEVVDMPSVNIRIEIGSTNMGSSPNDSLSVDIGYDNPKEKGKLVIVDGKIVKPKTITIDANKGTQTNTRNNSSWIVTQSGKAASLFVGKEIVDPSWLNNYKLVPTVIVTGGGSVVTVPGNLSDFRWRNVGTSLKVLPTLKDNGLIDVEVYPELSYLDGKGKREAVKVEGVSTRLTVREGQIIPLGGVIDEHREFYYNLFGPEFKRTGGGGVLNMTLKATILRPEDRGSALPRTGDLSSESK